MIPKKTLASLGFLDELDISGVKRIAIEETSSCRDHLLQISRDELVSEAVDEMWIEEQKQTPELMRTKYILHIE
ncbi:hypothetical protein [Paenibacillus sp. yr247]|uniref:hypothetical protein n=1 Tax=Paenibacillus sp. yr247 TaxID=1761880 RepID=UPI000B80E81E|nr:hypothetical protein [Paenibacillus sp. yr247]